MDPSYEDVDAAVDAAQEAFKTWKNVGVGERSQLLSFSNFKFHIRVRG
ncbi:aldehyde dehydrogenase family protein [Aquibacillus sediminis]